MKTTLMIRSVFSVVMAVQIMPFAYGAVIVENTGVVTSAGGFNDPTHRIAVGFLSPTVLTEIISVNAPFTGGEGSPNLSMALYGDTGGIPGTFLAALGSQTVTAAPTTAVFTPALAVPLSAATSYYLVVDCSNCRASGTVPGIGSNWLTSTLHGLGGMPGADFNPGIFFSTDSGATWGLFATSRQMIFQVNGNELSGSGVPEPSTFALVGAALAAGFLVRRGRLARL